MEKIEHAQTILTSKELAALKKKTGQGSTKDAIRTAIDFYMKGEVSVVN